MVKQHLNLYVPRNYTKERERIGDFSPTNKNSHCMLQWFYYDFVIQTAVLQTIDLSYQWLVGAKILNMSLPCVISMIMSVCSWRLMTGFKSYRDRNFISTEDYITGLKLEWQILFFANTYKFWFGLLSRVVSVTMTPCLSPCSYSRQNYQFQNLKISTTNSVYTKSCNWELWPGTYLSSAE